MREEMAKTIVKRINKVDGKSIAAIRKNFKANGEATTGVSLPEWIKPESSMFKVVEDGKRVILY